MRTPSQVALLTISAALLAACGGGTAAPASPAAASPAAASPVVASGGAPAAKPSGAASGASVGASSASGAGASRGTAASASSASGTGTTASAGGGAASGSPAAASAAASGAGSAPAAGSVAAKPSGAYKPTPLSPTVKLNVSGNGTAGDVGEFVAIDRGYFKDEGIEVSHSVTPSSAQALQEVAANQVQVALTTPDPALFNALSRGVAISIVAESTKNTATDKIAALVMRQDLLDSGKVKGPADLKGMTFGVPGASSQFFVEKYLAKGGLTASDVKFQTLPLPDELAALKNKGIDGAWEVEPLVTAAATQGLGKPVAFTGELLPNNLGAVQMVNPDFSKQQPDVLKHFVIAYLRGMRDYYHALIKKDADPAPVIQVLVNNTALKDPKMYSVIGLSGADPNESLDLSTWDQFQDYFIKLGQQQTKVDLNKYIDHQYVTDALAVLGRDS